MTAVERAANGPTAAAGADRAAFLPVRVRLGPDDWRFGRGAEPGQPVDLVITRVRHELTRFYGGRHLWVEGHAPDCRPGHESCRQILVRATALCAAGFVRNDNGSPHLSPPAQKLCDGN